MSFLAPLKTLVGGWRFGDELPVTGVSVAVKCHAAEVASVLGPARLADGIGWGHGIGDKAPVWHEGVVGTPAHPAQLVPACRIVEQINGSDEIKGAQRREGCGIMHLIGNAERLRPFLFTPQADHLR